MAERAFMVRAGTDNELVEEYLDVPSATHVTINTGNNSTKRLPYTVVATFDCPGHVQCTEGTRVYMAENVLVAVARDLETGLDRLQQKLSGTCATCGVQAKRLSQHYNEERECAEVELSV